MERIAAALNGRCRNVDGNLEVHAHGLDALLRSFDDTLHAAGRKPTPLSVAMREGWHPIDVCAKLISRMGLQISYQSLRACAVDTLLEDVVSSNDDEVAATPIEPSDPEDEVTVLRQRITDLEGQLTTSKSEHGKLKRRIVQHKRRVKTKEA